MSSLMNYAKVAIGAQLSRNRFDASLGFVSRAVSQAPNARRLYGPATLRDAQGCRLVPVDLMEVERRLKAREHGND